MANCAMQLPCDSEGRCMKCKSNPQETLTCSTCTASWHAGCLISLPEMLTSTIEWDCPDCCGDPMPVSASAVTGGTENALVAAIKAIEADRFLSEGEKAKKRQEILSGKATEEEEGDQNVNDALKILSRKLNCSFCMQLPERPVTIQASLIKKMKMTPCGHNFCLKCFLRWVREGKRNCAKCRQPIPATIANEPRINLALVAAIRMAKSGKSNPFVGPSKVYNFVRNEDRPDKAYATERAQRAGMANAASGKRFVTIAADHFGPILTENDPVRNQGVLVGECWDNRLHCRQWGAHLPHIASIAGQSGYGAQSVALSGGYKDDKDHGEWFLYTGSGGSDLSGNKRTNKKKSSDQKFVKMNDSLRVSCKMGYPVRVVRSHKVKHSTYAPEKGVRYDGIYRIEKCWRKIGEQGFKICRFLFVRCDNEPASWASEEHGDRPRPLPDIQELENATDITQRTESPSWDFDEEEGIWKWKKPPPHSKKQLANNSNPKGSRKSNKSSVPQRLLKEFGCPLCKEVMTQPVSTPCGHNFCKPCLEQAFAGKTLLRERKRGGHSLRSRKNVMQCPACSADLSDFLQNPQVNRELMDVIESFQNLHEDKEPKDDSPDAENDLLGTEGNTNEQNATEDEAEAERESKRLHK